MTLTQETKDTLEELGYAASNKGLEDYLQDLADDNGLDYDDVKAMFQVYGQEEMFDGLVTAVEDLTYL